MCGIQKDFIEYFICHTLATNATNYFWVPVIKWRAFFVCFAKCIFNCYHFFLRKKRAVRGRRSPPSARHGQAVRGAASCDRFFSTELPLLVRTPSGSRFCLLPGSVPFWTHLGLSPKGTLKIQDLVFITRKHLLNVQLHLEPQTNELTLGALRVIFFFLSQDHSFHGR